MYYALIAPQLAELEKHKFKYKAEIKRIRLLLTLAIIEDILKS